MCRNSEAKAIILELAGRSVGIENYAICHAIIHNDAEEVIVWFHVFAKDNVSVCLIALTQQLRKHCISPVFDD